MIVQQAGYASPIVQRLGSPVVQQPSYPPSALIVQQSATIIQQTINYQQAVTVTQPPPSPATPITPNNPPTPSRLCRSPDTSQKVPFFKLGGIDSKATLFLVIVKYTAQSYLLAVALSQPRQATHKASVLLTLSDSFSSWLCHG